MLKSTFNYLEAHTFLMPVPKSRDPRDGYWNVECSIVKADDAEVTFQYTCKEWLSETFTLPVPIRLDTLYECIYLTISENIAFHRIEYLCSKP